MFVLGIETSGLEGSIALLRDEVCLGSRTLNQPGRRHAQSLALEVDELLRSHEITPRAIDVVAVSRGPGSFTGLRVGMVFAKTFAYSTGCRFIEIDTFEVIAENVGDNFNRLFVIEDAQRDDLFVGEYGRDELHRWKQKRPIRITSIEEFLSALSKEDVVTGPGLRRLEPLSNAVIWLSEAAECRPRAQVVAELGHRLAHAYQTGLSSNNTDFWTATPFYLRLSAAEEKRAANAPNTEAN